MINNNQKRIALVIQYLGTHFHGWQRQPNQRTIQEEIEKAIASVVGHHVSISAAGRTDAGVHAAAQVAHFDYCGYIPPERWMAILNDRLPEGILIRGSAEVALTWHARFAASYRRYRYTIYTDKTPNLFLKPLTWHYYYAPLDESLIQAALTPLLGTHHLAAFHRANSSRTNSWVEVQAVECYRRRSLLHLEIQANGFLYGMVRLLVGKLVEVGTGKLTPESFTTLWKSQKREEVKFSAPARGLCLLRVGYEQFPFPPEIWFDTQPTFLFSQTTNTLA